MDCIFGLDTSRRADWLDLMNNRNQTALDLAIDKGMDLVIDALRASRTALVLSERQEWPTAKRQRKNREVVATGGSEHSYGEGMVASSSSAATEVPAPAAVSVPAQHTAIDIARVDTQTSVRENSDKNTAPTGVGSKRPREDGAASALSSSSDKPHTPSPSTASDHSGRLSQTYQALKATNKKLLKVVKKLFKAVKKGRVTKARLLIEEMGANPDAREATTGNTVLHIAAENVLKNGRRRDSKMMRYLKSRVTEKTAKNTEGVTASDIFRRHIRKSIDEKRIGDAARGNRLASEYPTSAIDLIFSKLSPI